MMTVEQVDAQISRWVAQALDDGMWPLGVRLSPPSYQALLARNGLEPHHIGRVDRDRLFARVNGFELPVDCDRVVADDGAVVVAMPARRPA